MGQTGSALKVSDTIYEKVLPCLTSLCRELGYSRQALYCYGKLYSLDPANVDALWDRASLAKEIGDLRTVRYL